MVISFDYWPIKYILTSALAQLSHVMYSNYFFLLCATFCFPGITTYFASSFAKFSLYVCFILNLPFQAFQCIKSSVRPLLGDFCHEPAVLLQTGLVGSSCHTAVILGFSSSLLGFPLALSYVLHPYFYFSYLHSLVPHFGRASILLACWEKVRCRQIFWCLCVWTCFYFHHTLTGHFEMD